MYTTIGAVRDYVAAYHAECGKRMEFPQALRELLQLGRAEEFLPATNAGTEKVLSQDAFEQYLMQIPVDIDRVLSNKDPMVIQEDATIPLGRNVLSYVHLPYVDDRLHVHNHFEINYIYAGSARQLIDQERRTLTAGEFCVIAPNMRHNVLVDDPDSLVISFPVRKSTFDIIFGNLLTQNDLLSAFFKNTLYRENQSNYLLFKTEQYDPEIVRLVQGIAIESNSSRKYAAVYVDNLVPLLFYTLLRKYSDTVLYYGDNPSDRIQSNFTLILTYVQSHYRTVTLEELSEMFNYSTAYISRLFRRNMNQSFTAIIQNLRMQHAAEYLHDTEDPIAEIAANVGYDSTDYFTRNFRRHFGCTPSEYRRNHYKGQ